MGKVTKIKWTDHTFNPWIGCTKVSPGCDNCYAAVSTPARTLKIKWGAGEDRYLTKRSNWEQVLKWNRQAAAEGRRHKIFCASLADVFDNAVNPKWRDALFELIRETPWLDWQLLTKRVGNVRDMLPADWGDGYPNVWLGITVVNQEEADRDIPKLLALPARVRFLSMEPLLGPVHLGYIGWPGREPAKRTGLNALTGDIYRDGYWVGRGPRIDWVIVGGESGKDARPMHPDWARSLRDQCAAVGVAFFFKQWGEWSPDTFGGKDNDKDAFMSPDGTVLPDVFAVNDSDCEKPCRLIVRMGKEASGSLLDSREHVEFPTARAA